MKKIAKILAMFAIFALAFSFAGCKSDDSDSSDDDVTISGGSTSGNGSSNGSSSGSNTSGGDSGNTSDNTSGGSSSGGSDTGDSSGSGSESGGTTSGGGTESGSTGGTTSGSGSGSGSTGGTTSGGGSGSGSTSGSSSGSTEQVSEVFVKIPAVSIDGTEKWKPSSEVFVSGRKFEIASFHMSDHPVTRGEYKAVMGSDPSTASAYDKDGKKLTDDDVKNNPVNCISWYDALVYCNTRSIKENLTPCYAIGGKTDPSEWGEVPTMSVSKWNDVICNSEADGYRLPTEAEWEWAARGGESYKYAGSDDIDKVAWYNGNTGKTGTRDVKTKKANGYGLYDMNGNVCEWCWDWYMAISGSVSSTKRCNRGGTWLHDDFSARVVQRSFDKPYNCSNFLGFRVVRNAK